MPQKNIGEHSRPKQRCWTGKVAWRNAPNGCRSDSCRDL